ncbi:hypothetical protein SAV14893_096730 [Streptomyces avermitilis]|uniref:Uncharacterized protein n=1 Tax=Streptomyces avermitilis TaxID=33903 RepID=A0A4D4ME86_STRAX|nr:hypothetical protein SAV14893_096730 [Streptomyces avermitilis]
MTDPETRKKVSPRSVLAIGHRPSVVPKFSSLSLNSRRGVLVCVEVKFVPGHLGPRPDRVPDPLPWVPSLSRRVGQVQMDVEVNRNVCVDEGLVVGGQLYPSSS